MNNCWVYWGTWCKKGWNVLSMAAKTVHERFQRGRASRLPQFSCIVVGTNSLYQCYEREILYHHTIRYAYFQLPSTFYTSHREGKTVLLRILKLSTPLSSSQNCEVERITIDFHALRNKWETKQDRGETTQELIVEGRGGSVIIRFPEIDPNGGKLVYVYQRG
jgi:hypothetical protein